MESLKNQQARSLRQAGACIVSCENDFMYQCIVAAQLWTWSADHLHNFSKLVSVLDWAGSYSKNDVLCVCWCFY